MSDQLNFEKPKWKNNIEHESGTELHIRRIDVRQMASRKLDQQSGFSERG